MGVKVNRGDDSTSKQFEILAKKMGGLLIQNLSLNTQISYRQAKIYSLLRKFYQPSCWARLRHVF